jgi:hypothetical protein
MRSAKWISVCVASVVWLGAWCCASAQWSTTQTTGIFEIRSEFTLDDKDSQALVAQITGLQSEVQKLLNLKSQAQTVEISLFRSKTTYRAHLAQRVPEGLNRPALFVQSSDGGRVYVYKRWGFETDLRHECTHAVLHNALPYVPMWLDEGLAEYFEVVAAKRSTGNPHLSSLKRSALFGWRPDIARLEAAEDLADMGADEYREAWAWAHFMLHGPPEIRQVLSDYLHDIQSGEEAGLLSERLVEVVPQAEIRLVEHIRHWR